MERQKKKQKFSRAELGFEPRTSYNQEIPKARILPLNYPARSGQLDLCKYIFYQQKDKSLGIGRSIPHFYCNSSADIKIFASIFQTEKILPMSIQNSIFSGKNISSIL